jgi:hypothetical protein
MGKEDVWIQALLDGRGPVSQTTTAATRGAGIVNPMFRWALIFDAYPYLFFCWMRRHCKGSF